MSNREHPDGGYAVVTAVLTTMVVLSLSVAAINLAVHNSDASGLDRDRVKAVHAAEAGINDAMARILGTGVATPAPCQITAATSTSPAATYVADIVYYSTWPIDPASQIACTSGQLPPGAVPLGAVIDSVGTAGRSNRRMETATRLTPTFGGVFDKAVFADGDLIVKNNVDIDGNVYTNEDWTCTTSIEIKGTFFGQGFASMSNTCRVIGDLWVNGDVTMQQSATVGGDVISALGAITLSNNSSIGGDAVAATACNGCVAPRVNPARVSIGTSPPPPQPEPESLPGITWDPADWGGYEIVEFTGAGACEAAKTSVLGMRTATQARVVRIAEPCRLSFSNNTIVVLNHDLAIVTDGSLEFVNRGVWTSPDARSRNLLLIVPQGTSCTTPEGNGDILKSNNTDFDHVHFLAYTPCDIFFANNNPSSSGQIYGGNVMLENNFALAFQAMLVPGTGTSTQIVGFQSQVAYIREIQL